jgi:transglutaminase-like putative cysteine protease
MHKHLSQNLAWAAALALASSCSSSGASSGESLDFEARNDFAVTVPSGAKEVRAWFALPDDRDPMQEVSGLRIETIAPNGMTATSRETRDAAGNRFLYVEGRGGSGGVLEVRTSFGIRRQEEIHSTDAASTRPLTAAEKAQFAPYLQANTYVQITPEIAMAAKVAVGKEQNPVRQARLLYDAVLDRVTYWVKFPETMKASPVGSATYTMENSCGNCTDFHSLYAAMARAVGLPIRMVYGSFFKGPLNGADEDQSYHCWIEFWAPNLEWIPLDVAIADVFVDDFAINEANARKVELTVADGYHGADPAMVEYYFGNLDARRVTWNRGRDLVLSPPTASGPVNAMPKGHVEIDGQVHTAWTRKLTYQGAAGK